MKEKKHIDRLFQEKFKDFEDFPKDKVWKNIRDELQKRQEPARPVLPLWSKIAGIAALLVLLFSVGDSLFFTNPNAGVGNASTERAFEQNRQRSEKPLNLGQGQSGSVVNGEGNKDEERVNGDTMDKSQTDNAGLVNQVLSKMKPIAAGDHNSLTKKSGNKNLTTDRNHTDKPNKKEHRPTEQKNGLAKTTKSTENVNNGSSQMQKTHTTQTDENGVGRSKGLAVKRKNENEGNGKSHNEAPFFGAKTAMDSTAVALSTQPNQADSLQKADVKKKRSLFDAIAKKNDEDQQKDNVNKKAKAEPAKFALRPNISPIYYSSLTGGSAIDPKFSDNTAKGEVTMSYGIDVSYAVSKRLKVRSGINKVNMSYNTKDIAFTSSVQAVSLKGLQKSEKLRNLAISSRPDKQQLATLNEVNQKIIDPYTSGQLNQRFEFIEVPLEVEYALVDHRFGINVIGGASTLILSKNAIDINSAQGTTKLGKASNLNKVSFTTNLGLGFDYDITNTLNFNVEPTFKYQINGFDGDTGGFQPYYFGVYTGFSFSF